MYHKNLAAFRLKAASAHSLIITGYNPPAASPYHDAQFTNKIAALINEHKKEHETVYIIGDFNARLGTLSGDFANENPITNAQGTKFKKLIKELNLHVLNSATTPIKTCKPHTRRGGCRCSTDNKRDRSILGNRPGPSLD